MSLLSRYRKSGGFAQLVQLIESCDATKRAEILALVGVEDPGWAVLARKKILTTEKIFSWPMDVLLEVMTRVPDRTLALVIHTLKEEKREPIFSIIPHIRSRNIRSFYDEKVPSHAEQHAASIKVFKLVRDLETEGLLKISVIDPDLDLRDKLIA
ncbi:MAG: FliG C-terminal domain-containing protein [Pseudobdellovibrionaceae bacterium]